MSAASVSRPKLWLPEDLAEYLGVPVGWVYKKTRRQGAERIPHLKLGKYLRFDPESPAFQEWLRAHESVDENEVGAGLTLNFPLNRVRPTEKAGQ